MDEMARVIALRSAVYIGEQGCPFEEEFDGNDFSATHLICHKGNEPVGCMRCGNTGYQGRLGLYEVMPLNDEIRAMVIERRSVSEIAASAARTGMRTMRDDGIEKVKRGLTSLAEVARVANVF